MVKRIFRQPVGRTKEQVREDLGCEPCSGEIILGEVPHTRASGMRSKREYSRQRVVKCYGPVGEPGSRFKKSWPPCERPERGLF